jgi:Patatin-like phospholipase
MHHLLETARKLRPFVKATSVPTSQAIPSSEPVLVRLRRACDDAFSKQETQRTRRKKAAANRVCIDAIPLPPVKTQEEHPHGETWGTTGDVRAIEILADVLAMNARWIPEALEKTDRTFYPHYLSYLLDTVFESAQPRYRPHSFGDLLWWQVWTWVSAREYVALLRDRHRKVADALSKTKSWILSRAHRETGRPANGSAPGTDRGQNGLTISTLGTGEIGPAAQKVKMKASEAWKIFMDAVGGGSPDDGPKQVVEVLSKGGEEAEDFRERLKKELLEDVDLVRRLADVSGAAVPFGLAHDVELGEILESREKRGIPIRIDGRFRYAPAVAAELGLFGLALSGGGIRSATFNLGVLQGLAEARLLREVDYLSTVSGGGYIGAWLATWIKRSGGDEHQRGVVEVERQLQVEPLPSPDDENVRAVRFLREYSNYLTPRTGFFSADTWTMIAIWVRNTLLNQAVLVMTLASILAIPWMIWTALIVLVPQPGTIAAGLFGSARYLTTIGGVLLLTASAITGWQLRRYHDPPRDRQKEKEKMLGPAGVLSWIVVPVLAGVWLLSVAIYKSLPQFADEAFRYRTFIQLSELFVSGLLGVAVIGKYWLCFLEDRIVSKATVGSTFWSWIGVLTIVPLGSVLPAVTGAAAIVALAARVAQVKIPAGYPEISLHWAVLGVPAIISILGLMIVLKLGIFGRNLRDDHREWWSRLGAWLAIVTLAWLVLFVFGMYSPLLFKYGTARLQKFVVTSGGIVWAAWTAAGVLLGKGEKSSGVGEMMKRARVRRWVVALAPYVFIAGLLVLVATGACWFVAGIAPADLTASATSQAHWTRQGLMWHWLMAGPLTFLALAFLMSSRVDVNEFSMHHFYKNRLVRCYLGASRDRRRDIAHRCPDPFTGFDSADDVDIADLRVEPGRDDDDLKDEKKSKNEEKLRPYVGPLPIVNVALNLVHGDDLAWQERKAQSFSFTPLHSGYERDESATEAADRFAPEGYRPTLLFGYPPFGIGLGTAVAISGAAASPNMGYHSSTPAAFLMTMFNARLGWWMGNPRDKYSWLRSGPRRGLLYLVNELFGLTNDRAHFVNLSDGGHFENLGIYELVRRRCRYIVACDAEQDDALKFNGLGNAIRKCRTDFGTEITIRATRIQPAAGTPHSTIHCVVGDITYPDGEVGTLLYLKASVTGDEPADVLEYKARQPAFPHHSTSDQFFDESQFESYRKLGFHVVQMAFDIADSRNAVVEERFNMLRDYWYPASSAIEQHFSGHAKQYEALLERLRQAPGLDFIDAAFFHPAATTKRERQELFVGASMLDLMQRVFIDLDLEHDGQHPHTAGWMAIFRNWMGHEAVLAAWEASRHSYGRRFQRFVEGFRKMA